MIALLQFLSVIVPAFFGVTFTLLIIGPALGGIVHGKRFTIQPWHALVAGVSVSVALWLAVTYGWMAS